MPRAAQIEAWPDTVMMEDEIAMDAEAFQSDLLSLVGEVGNWVVYYRANAWAPSAPMRTPWTRAFRSP